MLTLPVSWPRVPCVHAQLISTPKTSRISPRSADAVGMAEDSMNAAVDSVTAKIGNMVPTRSLVGAA